MYFTSIFALSASLLASQVQSQYANPLVNPAAYMNDNIEVNPDPYANVNPYPNPDLNSNPNVNANPNPVHYPMAAYATPSATPSRTPSMSMNMQMSMHHSMRPMSTHGAMHAASSMGPMNHLIPMHPPSPKSSMMTMASSMKPMATPAPMVHGMNLPAPAQPVRHGGIAPVEPMAPGSEVVPVLFGKPHGKDEGNAFCMGVCYPHKEQAKCGKPYVSYPVADGVLFFGSI